MSEKSKELVLTNTYAHEQMLSDFLKSIADAVLNMCNVSLGSGYTILMDKDKTHDPLHAERYLHNAKLLLEMAEIAHSLGEKARKTADELLTTRTVSYPSDTIAK